MKIGKYYSIADLANLCVLPTSDVADVMKFLSKYDFVHDYGKLELFAKVKIRTSPTESADLLKTLFALVQNS